MINWLRNKLRSFVFPPDEATISSVEVDDSAGFRDDHSLRFDVTTARGGVILSMRRYDQRADRHFYQNYVIPDGEDVSTAIAHIVSMEILRSSNG